VPSILHMLWIAVVMRQHYDDRSRLGSREQFCLLAVGFEDNITGTSMALTTCEECGRAISDRALSCPQCGMPREPNSGRVPHGPAVHEPNKRSPALVATVSIALVLILIVVVVLTSGPPIRKPRATDVPTNVTPPAAGQRAPLR